MYPYFPLFELTYDQDRWVIVAFHGNLLLSPFRPVSPVRIVPVRYTPGATTVDRLFMTSELFEPGVQGEYLIGTVVLRDEPDNPRARTHGRFNGDEESHAWHLACRIHRCDLRRPDGRTVVYGNLL